MTDYRPPPDGWVDFGRHVGEDCPTMPGELVFSEETGEDGLPRWERHDGCVIIGPTQLERVASGELLLTHGPGCVLCAAGRPGTDHALGDS